MSIVTAWAFLPATAIAYFILGLIALIKGRSGIGIGNPPIRFLVLEDKAARYMGGFFLVASAINILTSIYILAATEINAGLLAQLVWFSTFVFILIGYIIGAAIQFGRDMDRRKRRKKED